MNALVTGGAGFIGSHLVDRLVAEGHAVRVLDDLSSGLADNLPPEADLQAGSVTDAELVKKMADGCRVIFHQGALGSVRRSVENPGATDDVNTHGTLNVLEAARRAGVQRVVSASSSSVYGGTAPLPTSENHPTNPRSPYAVTKLAGELYARVYSEIMGVETVCLRYFNVYGPRQRPDSPYAAVIPLFIDALRTGRAPVIEGDGRQTRDFTYVADAVSANLCAAQAPADRCSGRVYNVAGGGRHSILDLLEAIGDALNVTPEPVFTDPRIGDVRDSQADLTAARSDLEFAPATSLDDGLALTTRWFADRAPTDRRGSQDN